MWYHLLQIKIFTQLIQFSNPPPEALTSHPMQEQILPQYDYISVAHSLKLAAVTEYHISVISFSEEEIRSERSASRAGLRPGCSI